LPDSIQNSVTLGWKMNRKPRIIWDMLNIIPG
jgi:hypothetical protein